MLACFIFGEVADVGSKEVRCGRCGYGLTGSVVSVPVVLTVAVRVSTLQIQESISFCISGRFQIWFERSQSIYEYISYINILEPSP